MNKTIVINLTRLNQQVGVRHDDGRPDFVHIVPRGRVELRDGLTVDARWLQMNANVVNVVVPKQPVVMADAGPAIKVEEDKQ